MNGDRGVPCSDGHTAGRRNMVATGMRRVLLVIFAASAGCGDSPCDPNTETCSYSADVSTMTVAAGREDEDTCQSWTLNKPDRAVGQHDLAAQRRRVPPRELVFR